MRLTQEERTAIREAVQKILPSGKAYLFGSRVDDDKRGGDIDLLILADGAVPRTTRWDLIHELEDRLGEQKIDIVCENKNRPSSFGQLAMLDAVEV